MPTDWFNRGFAQDNAVHRYDSELVKTRLEVFGVEITTSHFQVQPRGSLFP